MRARLLPALLAALAATACGPKYVRERVFEHRSLLVTLRAEVRDDEVVDRHFSQPLTISSVRLAHILASIDVRDDADEGGERKPAFQTALLYTVGEKMALAFSQADSTQEVVVQAVRVEKRFGIFTAKYLTSFTAWVDGDDLVIDLSHVDWPIPKDKDDDALPEPWPGRQVQEFKVLPAEGLIPVGTQVLSVDWRSPTFREPKTVRVGPGGKLLRRHILLESPPEPEGGAEQEQLPSVPTTLSAETLRALADLQEQRANGEISETTYHQKRRDILRKAAEELTPEGAPPTP